MKGERQTRGGILLVGRRKGAVAAAGRCGWKPVIIDRPPRGEQAPRAFGGSASWATELASEFFPDDPPVAVVAVATGAVTAAAEIRAHFGLPGIDSATAMRCHDKLVMKKAIAAAGLPCAPWVETAEGTSAADLIETLGLPVVLKMPISSGGREVWICQSAMEIAAHLRPGLLAEAMVPGVEMSVESFRSAGRTLFRNHTRYLKPRWANVVPADLASIDAQRVDRLTEDVHDTLGIGDGMTHMELFLGDNGPIFGEIAARPPGGYLMTLLSRAYDFDPWEVLLRLAVGETPRFPDRATRAAGVWIIHPGAGTVCGMDGLDRARALPGVIEVSCNLKVGDVVAPRLGSGDSNGRILVQAPTPAACASILTRAAEAVHISMTPPGD